MHRRPSLARLIGCLVLLAAVAAGCAVTPSAPFGRDIELLLEGGRDYIAELARRDTDALADAELVALGYAERARLGLGSPFRLIAYATRDRRLPTEQREQLAYGLLALTLDGETYEVDPGVLDLLPLRGAAGVPEIGRRHLEMIERVVDAAPTPGSGERAVRIGYGIAETERITPAVPQGVVTHVAALVSDRARARLDATDLLRSARQQGSDPLRLVEEWRRERRFRVEQPAQAAIDMRWEAYEARRGEELARELRVTAQRLSAPTMHAAYGRAPAPGYLPSRLSGEAAIRLLELALEHDYPAQAPVAVAVMMNGPALETLAGPEARHREAVARFAEVATSEERFVAASAALRAERAVHDIQLSLVSLQAATVLRVWNQEEPWFPGDPAPQPHEVVARFGLRGIEFGSSVPVAWRPYYTRMLAHALADLRTVAPTVSLRDLTFRIGPLPGGRAALALHQPRERRIVLPPASGAGTIAHEVAHELDRQLARRRYGRSSSYATDLGSRGRRADRVVSSVNSLSAAFGPEPGDSLATAHATRAAEIFARGFDWFTAIQLAREGRVGGYLTSFQDPAITGYGTTRGQEVGFTAVPALLELLDQVAPVLPAARTWAVERFGPNRSVSSEELVSALRRASASGAPGERIRRLGAVRAQALESLDATSCRLTGIEDVRRLVDAQRALIETTAEAAVHGIVVDAVRTYALALPAAPRARAVDAWLAWRLSGAPEPADEALHQLAAVADPLLLEWSFHLDEARRADVAAGGFALPGAPSLCRGNPFASLPLRQPEAARTAAGHALLAPSAPYGAVLPRTRVTRGTNADRAGRPYPPLGTGFSGGSTARR